MKKTFKVLRPFGPTIAKVDNLVKELNDYTESIK